LANGPLQLQRKPRFIVAAGAPEVPDDPEEPAEPEECESPDDEQAATSSAMSITAPMPSFARSERLRASRRPLGPVG
jgi:hypothetical protein